MSKLSPDELSGIYNHRDNPKLRDIEALYRHVATLENELSEIKSSKDLLGKVAKNLEERLAGEQKKREEAERLIEKLCAASNAVRVALGFDDPMEFSSVMEACIQIASDRNQLQKRLEQAEQSLDCQSNLIANIADTCRSRGVVGPKSLDERVIEVAQRLDQAELKNAQLREAAERLMDNAKALIKYKNLGEESHWSNLANAVNAMDAKLQEGSWK